MINFIPFPDLETQNLSLRRMNHSDINDLFEMRSDPRMIEHTDSKADDNKEETKAYIDKMNKGIDKGKWIIWAIEHKASGKVIGSISIWKLNHEQKIGELGFGIIQDYQGKGLMKEALLRVADYGLKDMGLRFLDAYTEENNQKSINLLKSCHFIEAGRVDDEGFYSDRVYHMIVYRLQP